MLYYYPECLMSTHMTYATLLLWKNITDGSSDPPNKQQLFPWPFLGPSSSEKRTTGCTIGESAGRRAASSSGGRWFVTQFNSGLHCWESPLIMKVSLGVQSKNCSHHLLSLPTYRENPMSPSRIHTDQPGRTLSDPQAVALCQGLAALPRVTLSQPAKEARESRGSVAPCSGWGPRPTGRESQLCDLQKSLSLSEPQHLNQ